MSTGGTASRSSSEQPRSAQVLPDPRPGLGGLPMTTRRQWSTEEKLRIVLEGLKPQVNVEELCRQHGIHSSQVLHLARASPGRDEGRAPSEARRRRAPGRPEVARMRKLIADLTIANDVLREDLYGRPREKTQEEARDGHARPGRVEPPPRRTIDRSGAQHVVLPSSQRSDPSTASRRADELGPSSAESRSATQPSAPVGCGPCSASRRSGTSAGRGSVVCSRSRDSSTSDTSRGRESPRAGT